MKRLIAVLTLCGVFSKPLHAGLVFDFDYRYDTNGFFDDPIRREALVAAGHVVNRYVDELDAIIPEGDNTWQAFFTRPDGGSIILENLPVPQDTMQIFVAGRELSGRLAQAVTTGPLGFGDTDWVNTVAYRGQWGEANDPATDFGPMGGSVSFNNDLDEVPWHFERSTENLEPNEFDFVTVAAHELIHLLGLGTSVSFNDHINGLGQFVGDAAVHVGSPTNTTLQLDSKAHWQSGTKSTWNENLQEALLAPGIFPGRRAFPTELDRAALLDIGWEPATAGDANLDRRFTSDDLIEALQYNLYETGQLAGWVQGDWNDNGMFESGDLILALQTDTYEQPPLLATGILDASTNEPSTVTLNYDRHTGQLQVETSNTALTAIEITSTLGQFQMNSGSQHDGPFDVDSHRKLFAMQADGFQSLEFGNALPPELSIQRLQSDLRIEGAWMGGGPLTQAHVRFVPEPTDCSWLGFFAIGVKRWTRRIRRHAILRNANDS